MQQENEFDELKEKAMKNIVMIAFVMAFLVLVPTAKAYDELCVDLVAGQTDDVGDVCVERVADELHIQYLTDPWWPLNDAHVHVAPVLEGIPQNNGNPVPGNFLWTADENGLVVVPLIGELPGEKKKDDPIPYDWTGEESLILAVHGVVGICDCETLLEVMPDVVEDVEIYYPGDDSYFDVVISGAGILDGTHKGWCADIEDEIGRVGIYTGEVYSTLCEDVDAIPEDAIVFDVNLPLVNWILNNRDGYTAGDVQYAIWDILSGYVTDDANDTIHSSGGKGWPEPQNYDLERGIELAEAAEANGGAFEPECGQVMAVVFIPPPFEVSGRPRQTVLLEIPALCGCETAWGAVDEGEGAWGLPFPGKNWALYFNYLWGDE